MFKETELTHISASAWWSIIQICSLWCGCWINMRVSNLHLFIELFRDLSRISRLWLSVPRSGVQTEAYGPFILNSLSGFCMHNSWGLNMLLDVIAVTHTHTHTEMQRCVFNHTAWKRLTLRYLQLWVSQHQKHKGIWFAYQ